MIASPFGPVPLSQVARIVPTSARYAVSHDGGQRFVSITFNVVGRGLQATVDDAKTKVAALNLPPASMPSSAALPPNRGPAPTSCCCIPPSRSP
jgi:Cu/Ag efflux pump CusA